MYFRTVALLAAALAWTAGAAADLHDLVKVSTSARPIIATQDGLVIAVVFPRESTAQLVIREGKVQRESREFEFPHAATYGAIWVENIEIKSRRSFVVHIRTRQTCGPGLYAFKFAFRSGDWLVSGLDREEHECSDEGPEPAGSISYNFLTGRSERAHFVGGHRVKATVERKQFPRFKLIDFDPLHSRYAP